MLNMRCTVFAWFGSCVKPARQVYWSLQKRANSRTSPWRTVDIGQILAFMPISAFSKSLKKELGIYKLGEHICNPFQSACRKKMERKWKSKLFSSNHHTLTQYNSSILSVGKMKMSSSWIIIIHCRLVNSINSQFVSFVCTMNFPYG